MVIAETVPGIFFQPTLHTAMQRAILTRAPLPTSPKKRSVFRLFFSLG